MHIQKKHKLNFTNAKGITLIALTITIIVMLILTGTTVGIAIGDGGLIQSAKDVKKEQQIEIYKTQIGILTTNWELRKAMNDSITIDDLWTDFQEEGIINDSETDVTGENGNYVVTTPEGYEIEVKLDETGGSSGSLQGKITSEIEWNSNNGTATVTLSTTEQGVTIQYKIRDVDTEYQDYTAPINISDVTKQTVIVAKIIDENNETVGNANIVVRDNEKPIPAAVELSSTTTTVNQTITATVTHTDTKSGINLENCKWAYNTISGEMGTDPSSYAGAFDSNPDTISLTATTTDTHYLHILSVDRAGNAIETRITVPSGTQIAEGITLNQTQATLEVGGSVTLTATINPDNTTDKTVTWTSSDQAVATVSNSNGTSGTPITVTGIKAGNTTITATTSNGLKATCEITVEEAEPGISGTTGTTHTATTLNYTWEEINTIAKVISDNYGTGTNQVNNQTAEVTVTANNKTYTVGVGDTMEVMYNNSTSCTVRIMGFNHDELKDKTIYGGTNTYAGISFEFVDFITGTTYKSMNSSLTNANGWAATKMRKDLNGYTTADAAQSGSIGGEGAKLSNSTYIKQVKKAYLPTYNSATVSTTPSEDYLWLLSCSEIWSTGIKTTGKGNAMGIEGNQYKWYTDNENGIAYNVANSNFVKKANDSEADKTWWLRSPHYDRDYYFGAVNVDGRNGSSSSTISSGVAPGFCI